MCGLPTNRVFFPSYVSNQKSLLSSKSSLLCVTYKTICVYGYNFSLSECYALFYSSRAHTRRERESKKWINEELMCIVTCTAMKRNTKQKPKQNLNRCDLINVRLIVCEQVYACVCLFIFVCMSVWIFFKLIFSSWHRECFCVTCRFYPARTDDGDDDHHHHFNVDTVPRAFWIKICSTMKTLKH